MEFTTVNMESEGGGVMTDEYVIILLLILHCHSNMVLKNELMSFLFT